MAHSLSGEAEVIREKNRVKGQEGAKHGHKGGAHGHKGAGAGMTVPLDELHQARARLIGAPSPPDLKGRTMDEVCDSIEGIDQMRRYIAHLLIVDKHFDAGRGQAIDAILEKLERRLVKGGAQQNPWEGHPLTLALNLNVSRPETFEHPEALHEPPPRPAPQKRQPPRVPRKRG